MDVQSPTLNSTGPGSVCFPFLMDTRYEDCIRSQAEGHEVVINELGQNSCCLVELVDTLYNKGSWLRGSLECKDPYNNKTAPLFLSRPCSENISDCLGTFLLNISRDMNKKCGLDTKKSMRYFYIYDIIVKILLCMFGTLFNCSLITVFCTQRSLWKALNMYIVSDLLGDQLLIVFTVIPNTIDLISDRQFLTNVGMCRMYMSSWFLWITIMTYMTVALSVERYIIVVNCFQSRGMSTTQRTTSRAVVTNAAVWILSCAVFTAVFFRTRVENNYCFLAITELEERGSVKEYVHVILIVGCLFSFPFAVIASLYVITFFHMRSSAMVLSSASRVSDGAIKSRERTANMFIAIIAMFFFCQIPINVTNIYDHVTFNRRTFIDSAYLEKFTQVSLQIQQFHICVNPVILLVMSSEIRSHFFNLLGAQSLVVSTADKR